MSTQTRRLSSFISERRYVILLAIVIIGLVWALFHPVRTNPPNSSVLPEVSTSSQPVIVPPKTLEPSMLVPSDTPIVAACRTQSKQPFRPRAVQLLGIASYPAVPLDLVRTANGVQLPIPPDENPGIFAWVSGDRAADDNSILRLTAHTWSDGSAVGNVINTKIRPGAIIVVHGSKKAQVACYRVTAREQVTIVGATSKQKVKANAVLRRYNGIRAQDDLGIMVCSGEHFAVGVYRDRLNVFATRYGVHS